MAGPKQPNKWLQAAGQIAPYAIPGVGMLLGGILGGAGKSEPSMPQWWVDMMLKEMGGLDELNQFMPSAETFEAATQADIDIQLDKMPIQLQQFKGQAASRGVFTAGEELTGEYRNVYAPIATGVAGIQTKGNLAYERSRSDFAMNVQKMRLDTLRTLGTGLAARHPSDINIWDTVGELGGSGLKYSILKDLGIF